MARFTYDPNRLNYNISQTGREYQLRLVQRAQTIFTTLLNLLSSSWISSIEGPNYTLELKAVAVELARIELALEDVDRDRSFATTRSDFLYSIVGYLLLVNGRIPPMQWSDTEFQNFLLALIAIYFQGSVPKSISDLATYFLTGDVLVTENFLLVRQGASGYDISDQFGFGIDVIANSGGGFPDNMVAIDATIRMLLDVIRPAHTLFTIRYIFQDAYLPNGVAQQVLDTMSWSMRNYYYDDLRSYWSGLRDRDRLGRKQNQRVYHEDHSQDF